MKKLTYYVAIFILPIFAGSCKKDNSAPVGGTSLTIIHAVVGSDALITNFSNDYTLKSYYLYSDILNYGSYGIFDNEFGLKPGNTILALYQFPDTTSKSTPLYRLNLNMAMGTIHTLFLTGQVSSPDTLFTTDHPPYHPYSDSSVGVRFVNLSPGSDPVNVTLSTTTSVNEFSGIGYKGITDFKSYPCTAAIKSYIFQFRDAATGTLLGSVTMNGINNGAVNTSTNNYRYRNFTIVLRGLPGGSGATAQRAFLVNNY